MSHQRIVDEEEKFSYYPGKIKKVILKTTQQARI